MCKTGGGGASHSARVPDSAMRRMPGMLLQASRGGRSLVKRPRDWGHPILHATWGWPPFGSGCRLKSPRRFCALICTRSAADGGRSPDLELGQQRVAGTRGIKPLSESEEPGHGRATPRVVRMCFTAALEPAQRAELCWLNSKFRSERFLSGVPGTGRGPGFWLCLAGGIVA